MEQTNAQIAVAGHAPGMQGGQSMPGQPQPVQPGSVDMVALAEKESVAMLNGQSIPPTEGATPDHSQVHRDIINSRTFKAAPPTSQQLLIAHYKGEIGDLGNGL